MMMDVKTVIDILKDMEPELDSQREADAVSEAIVILEYCKSICDKTYDFVSEMEDSNGITGVKAREIMNMIRTYW